MHNEKCIENENNIKNQKLKNKMKIRKKYFKSIGQTGKEIIKGNM